MRPSLTQKQQKETHKDTDTELCTELAKMALQKYSANTYTNIMSH